MARGTETIGQEVLLVTGGQDDPIVPRSFEEDNVRVGFVEHDLHELNALARFSAANVREGLINNRRAAVQLYGRNAPAVLRGAARNRRELLDQAKNEIYQSVGYFVVEAASEDFPHVDLPALEKDTYNRWDAFKKRFAGSVHITERHAYARQLRDHITDAQSNYHQKKKIRPHMPNIVRKERELPELSSRDRLVAISEDPRTRYLPSNNREKNMVMGWLDYLDNPDHPLGINNHFFEIFIRNMYLGRKKGDPVSARRDDNLAIASRSGVSIAYELHDFLLDAHRSLEDLTDFGSPIEFANPNLKLSQIFPQGHPAFAPLIRHRDQVRFRETGEAPEGIKNPFQSYTDRWEKGVAPGKHKNVEDIYTGKDKPKEMKEYIQAETAGMTVKQARKLWQAATENQQTREAFLWDRVDDISKMAHQRHLPMGALAVAFRDRPLIAV